jgi:hypothetical protein
VPNKLHGGAIKMTTFFTFLPLPFAADFDIMMKSLSDGIFAIALAHLTITVSICTMLLWFYIIRLIGASQASAFYFLVPIFGIIQSAIVLNDRITTPDVRGIFVVFSLTHAGQQTIHYRRWKGPVIRAPRQDPMKRKSRTRTATPMTEAALRSLLSWFGASPASPSRSWSPTTTQTAGISHDQSLTSL